MVVCLKVKKTWLYRIPYRPKTNAIESWFNQFKNNYFQLSNNGAITYNQLKIKIKNY